MAGSSGSPAFSSPLSIGNCKVEIIGNNVSYKSMRKSLLISVSDAAKIKISADASIGYATEKSCGDYLLELRSEGGKGEKDLSSGCYSFLLLNPKDIDSRSKALLQDVLKLYMKELPAMNYAANTGKESLFLERCVSSGKYRTMVLKLNGAYGSTEVIAALSYQIIPADTQYAEIPVAAVSSSYQNKGIGRFLYMELRQRLQNVGVLTLFCWGDKESEGFWVKQGFVSIAEVDGKGRVRRLPIKADIRRALCFPGGSTLMVSHLSKDPITPANPPTNAKLCSPQPDAKSPLLLPVETPEVMKTNKYCVGSSTNNEDKMNRFTNDAENSQIEVLERAGSLAEEHKINDVVPSISVNNSNHSIDLVGAENESDADGKLCTCSGLTTKRKIWEASWSSLKSKKVKGGHHIDCHLDSSWDLNGKNGSRNIDDCDDRYLGFSRDKPLEDVTPMELAHHHRQVDYVDENRAAQIMSREDGSNEELPLKGEHPVIMLMNIADDTKKTSLTKIVEELGGVVTSDGSNSTHVITGKARRTLNFCTALCRGSWIVSPNWLKASFREGRFVGELPFVLKDEDYMFRYRTELKDAVLKAKASPCALLKGYDICLSMHVQPPVGILSTIVKSAGGNVLRGLHKVLEPSKAIFVACEEDMDEALAAAKRGVWTYSSDWFMSCIMRQALDFEAPQFSESL